MTVTTPETTGPAAGPAAPGAEPSLGQLVQQASESVSTILRGEIELAKLELRDSVKNAGVGAGMFAAAGVLAAFSLTFLLVAIAELLVFFGLPQWAGFLIVFGGLLAVVALLVILGLKKVKRVNAPQRTIETSRDTVAYLKSHPKPTP